jgi:hypothetical protein
MNVVFVAPYILDNTLRYVRSLLGIEGVRLGLLTCEPPGRLRAVDPVVASALAGVVQVPPGLTGTDLARGVETLRGQLGPVNRLLGVLEQLQVPLGEARSVCGIPGMDHATSLNFRDKARMKEVLRAAGLPVARHRLLTDMTSGEEAAKALGFPMILKPVAGVGAKATYRVADGAALESTLRQLRPSPHNPIQAEEFVTGTERTFEAVWIDGSPVWWSGTRYHPTPLAVLENPWMQYTVLLPREVGDPWTSFEPTNRRALAALGLHTGISHMEWFERADGSFVIGEVGARPPGVNIMPLMSLVNGVDMVDAWCRLMVRGEWPNLRRQKAAGSVFFRGQGRGSRVVAVRGLDEAQAEVGHLVVDRRLPQIGQPATSSYEGEGFAIVAGESTAEVDHAMARLVRLVRVELG